MIRAARPVVACLGWMMLVLPAGAADLYECRISPQTNAGWIPEVLVISHDPATGAVQVADRFSRRYEGGAVPGAVKWQDEGTIVFRWAYDMVRNRSQFSSGLRYTASLRRSDGRMTVTMAAVGYDNRFRGRGTCRKLPGKGAARG